MTRRGNCQSVLEAVGATPGGLGLDAVQDATGLERKAINACVQQLRRRSLIEITSPGQYRVTAAGAGWLAKGRAIASGQGVRRRACSGLRERAWWVMRELHKFSLPDLLDRLADGSERDAAGNLRKYVGVLERAGIVQRMKRRVAGASPTSNGYILYWLKRDLGRFAPVWRRSQGAVFDPNSGELLPLDAREAAHD